MKKEPNGLRSRSTWIYVLGWLIICGIMTGLFLVNATNGQAVTATLCAIAVIGSLIGLGLAVRVVIKSMALLLCLGCFTAHADFTNAINRQLEFIYPTNDLTPQTVVYLFTNSNVALPVTSWPLFVTITNLNVVTGTNALPVTVSLPRTFFIARASNEWGLGDFSEVLRSAPPKEDIKLKLR